MNCFGIIGSASTEAPNGSSLPLPITHYLKEITKADKKKSELEPIKRKGSRLDYNVYEDDDG